MRIQVESSVEHITAAGQNLFGENGGAKPTMIVPGGTTSCFASCCSTCTCGVLTIDPASAS